MGLWNWLSGRPTRDRFAEMVIHAMRAAGEKRKLLYDRRQFCIRLEEESVSVSNLANMYREYCAAPRSQRRQVLTRLIQGWFVQYQELPDEFADLHPDLLPVVRPRAYFEFIGLHGDAESAACRIPPYQVLGDYLGIGLVYDRPASMQVITQRDLDHWHVTFYEALEAARENLKQLESAFMGPKEGPGTYVSVSGDSYDASRLVLSDQIREFQVRGEPVAMAPNRNTLIVTGSEDLEGLGAMVKVAETALKEPRAISGVPLRLDRDDWVTWLPEPDHPLHAAFDRFRIQMEGEEYAGQKQLLDELHVKTGQDVFVASYTAVHDKAAGTTFSYAVWAKDVITLLPRVDKVAFIAAADSEPTLVDWDRVVQTVGDLMEPKDFYPARYLIERFPNEQQLAAMGAGDSS
jgi:hypothetical protein